MILETILLKDEGKFASYVREWAEHRGVEVVSYEYKPSEDETANGLLLINENQDIRKDYAEMHAIYDRKHIPTQKIDLNGTLQVAINSFRIWADTNKCKRILILGDDELVKNDNLDRFFSNIK